jgi:hypothetical protein
LILIVLVLSLFVSQLFSAFMHLFEIFNFNININDLILNMTDKGTEETKHITNVTIVHDDNG